MNIYSKLPWRGGRRNAMNGNARFRPGLEGVVVAESALSLVAGNCSGNADWNLCSARRI